jgi:hypothetical protein
MYHSNRIASAVMLAVMVGALPKAAGAQTAGKPAPAYVPLPSQVQHAAPTALPNDQPAQSPRIGAPSQPSTATFAPAPAPVVAPPPPPVPAPLPPR